MSEGSEWYRLSKDFMEKAIANSGHIYIPDSESHRPLLIKAGSILPIVNQHDLPKLLNTANLRKVAIELWLMPTSNGTAQGDLFFDDGETIDTVQKGQYNYYQFKLNKCHLTINVSHSGYHASASNLDIFKVKTIRVALSSTHNIRSETVETKLNDRDILKSTIETNSLKIEFHEALDLLLTTNNMTISFQNKNTKECFTH